MHTGFFVGSLAIARFFGFPFFICSHQIPTIEVFRRFQDEELEGTIISKYPICMALPVCLCTQA